MTTPDLVSLPPEVHLLIVERLDSFHRHFLRSVCKHFRTIVKPVILLEGDESAAKLESVSQAWNEALASYPSKGPDVIFRERLRISFFKEKDRVSCAEVEDSSDVKDDRDGKAACSAKGDWTEIDDCDLDGGLNIWDNYTVAAYNKGRDHRLFACSHCTRLRLEVHFANKLRDPTNMERFCLDCGLTPIGFYGHGEKNDSDPGAVPYQPGTLIEVDDETHVVCITCGALDNNKWSMYIDSEILECRECFHKGMDEQFGSTLDCDYCSEDDCDCSVDEDDEFEKREQMYIDYATSLLEDPPIHKHF